jgi:hypothetical protein
MAIMGIMEQVFDRTIIINTDGIETKGVVKELEKII